jgi:hypothetical protein
VSARSLSRSQLLELARQVVSRGGLLRVQVRGQSMRPAIADDDQVVLCPIRSPGPCAGEVVLAETRLGPRLHRVVARGVDEQGPWLRIRGDRQVGPGQLVRPEDVVAAVARVERPLYKALGAYWRHLASCGGRLRPRPSDARVSGG